MYNNLSLYRDNGLQKQAQGTGTITTGDPNSPELYTSTDQNGTMGYGDTLQPLNSTVNSSGVYGGQPGTSVAPGQNTGAQVQHSTLTSTPVNVDPNPQPTSYTMLQPQTPQFYEPQQGTYTLPQQTTPLTSQGTHDAAIGQTVQYPTQVTPEGYSSTYGLDQTMQQPSTDIFTSDYILNNIAPSGAVGLGIGALAGALSGGQPVKTGLGAGVGAFGGKMLYDYLANNEDTKQYIQQFQDWASNNLWDGAGEHVKYLAPILGGLAGFAVTN